MQRPFKPMSWILCSAYSHHQEQLPLQTPIEDIRSLFMAQIRSLNRTRFHTMNSSSKLVIFPFLVAVILLSTCAATAARPLHGEQRPGDYFVAIESLQRGQVPPSGSSSCTNIPGGGGGGSCPLNERNFAGRVARHAPPTLHPRVV